MRSHVTIVNTAVQPPMFPPEATEICLRIGVSDSGNHIQFQLEVWSATDGTLIGMEARPSVPVRELDRVLDEWCGKLGRTLDETVWPFLKPSSAL